MLFDLTITLQQAELGGQTKQSAGNNENHVEEQNCAEVSAVSIEKMSKLKTDLRLCSTLMIPYLHLM